MSPFRFSLFSFIAVVTLLALGLGAMASQSRLAISAAYSMFVASVCLAAVVALIPGGTNRPFCIGFAVFGLRNQISSNKQQISNKFEIQSIQ